MKLPSIALGDTLRHRPSLMVARAAALMAVGAMLGGCSAAPTGAAPGAAAGDRMELPPVMLWAWERPEDLRALDGAPGAGRMGVAPLVATITLRGDEVGVRTRRQPLRVAPDTPLCPVVRIEVGGADPPTLDEAQVKQVAEAIASVARRADRDGHGRVQIDFEATASQRAFYRSLLGELRAQLRPGFHVAITALASWCLRDRWLAGLPVDEVVPMYYRLGPRAAEADEALERDGDFPSPSCRTAIGLSLDDPPRLPERWPPTPRRTWIFSPRAWTPEQVATVAAAAFAMGPERRDTARP